MNLVEKAKAYAIKCHLDTNSIYDKRPYQYHLQWVVDIANGYIHLIPPDKKEVVLAACWVHDVIEECRQTYNDVKAELGEEVAELAYALTNEKGRTRAERANQKYYRGIKQTPNATFVKNCDRIANIEYSLQEQSSMFTKYRQEAPAFKARLYTEKLKPMFNYLDELTQHEDWTEAARMINDPSTKL